MPVNQFSVGSDVTLVIVANGAPLGVSLITGFMSKQDTIDQKIKGLDGITRHVRFPDGWSGSFDYDRMDSTLDDYFAQIEADYYAGVQDQPASITQIIQEPNGNVSQWRYLNVLLKYDDAGAWKGDATVKQKMSFLAQTRLKVA
jgi:hypothetical protein